MSAYVDDDHIDDAARAIAKHSPTVEGCYVTLNPVMLDLMARANNRFKTYAKTTTTDKEITCRRWFLIDIDVKRPRGISSSDSEHEAALDLALQIRSVLTAQGWPDPIYADSGNGAHLLFRIDAPNDAATTTLIKAVLANLSAQFSNATAQIDISCFNAARISKIYGTLARKGSSLPERPHRLARLIEVPEELRPVPRDMLEALASFESSSSTNGCGPDAAHQQRGGGHFDLDRFMLEHAIGVKRRGPWEGGERIILENCVFDSGHSGSSAAILRLASGALQYKCQHDGCADRKWADLRELFEPGYRERTQLPAVASNGASPPAVNGREIKPLPAPMKASDWFREEEQRFENASYIWDGILEAGAYAMIGGKKGHGKSTFARTLALKISRGEKFMGRAAERCKVWYLDFEPGGRGRIATLKSLGWCDDDWLEFSTIPPPANHPDVFKWLRQYIVERGFKVIIVDTLFKLLRIDGANDYDKALYAQVPLEEICRELSVCIVVLHHARKNGQFSSQQSCAEQMLGATSIAGAACACILINHRGENYTFRMDPPRYGTAIEGELVLERDVSGFVSEAGSWKRKWVNQTKQLVMEAASAQAGWFASGDLQVIDTDTGEPLSKRSRNWAIGELVKENLLEKGERRSAAGRGKPVEQYRVMTLISGARNAPDQKDQKGL